MKTSKIILGMIFIIIGVVFILNASEEVYDEEVVNDQVTKSKSLLEGLLINIGKLWCQ